MKRTVTLLSCVIASLALLGTGSVFAAPADSKQIKKSAVQRAKVAKKPYGALQRAKVSVKTAQPEPVENAAPVPLQVLSITAPAVSAAEATPSAVAASAPAPVQAATGLPAPANPYLHAARGTGMAAAAMAPSPNPYVAPRPGNPYLNPYQAAKIEPLRNFGDIIDSVQGAMPSLPLEGQSLLPKIKTVYPTGEKPLVVVTFKCPTEMVGITTPPIKALRELVNLGMEGINRTDLLAFNLQQVCQ